MQEEIVAVSQNLETLRVEHTDLLDELSAAHDKGSFISRNIELIELGLDDAQTMLSLARYLDTIETEKQHLRSEACRLSQENKRLECELADAQQKLRASDDVITQLEEDKKSLEFEASMRKCDPVSPEAKDDLDADLLLSEKNNAQSTTVPPKLCEFEQCSPLKDHYLQGLHKLAIRYGCQGNYEMAVPMCKEILKNLKESRGHHHLDVAAVLNTLALIYRNQNKYKEAADLLVDVLAIQEKNFGMKHPDIAATLNNLTVLYVKQGKYKEAEPLIKRALEISEKTMGYNSPVVATHAKNLGLIYMNQGKYEGAEWYFQLALEIHEPNLGLGESEVAILKRYLTHCYNKQRQSNVVKKSNFII